MYRFTVIDADNPKWEQILHSSYMYDFHHTTFYHKIDSDYDSFMFIAEDKNDFVALPLVKRPIQDTNWFDFTSVYGYCGPLTNRENFDFSPELVDFFKLNFNNYCKDNKIVSVFSRLHPLIRQEAFFNDFGNVFHLNKTVAIDLKLKPEEQKSQYRKSNKSELNQLRRKGFYVEEAKSADDIDRFIAIYYETMDRVAATPNYYFSKDYFHSFLNNSHFDSKLLLAKNEEKVVAGAIFTNTGKIMQYHLAGTTEEFIRETPMKLILDEARLKGNELELEYLHLGGGVGGSDDDSLFRFKSGFSNLHCQFSVWKYIYDREQYNKLVEQANVSDKNSTFFPLYRM